MYKRKTRDEYHLMVNYGQGYEHEITEHTYREIKQRLKEYRENCPEYPVTYRKKRVKIDK